MISSFQFFVGHTEMWVAHHWYELIGYLGIDYMTLSFAWCKGIFYKSVLKLSNVFHLDITKLDATFYVMLLLRLFVKIQKHVEHPFTRLLPTTDNLCRWENALTHVYEITLYQPTGAHHLYLICFHGKNFRADILLANFVHKIWYSYEINYIYIHFISSSSVCHI